MKTSPGRKTFIVLNALFIILVCVAIMVPIWMVIVTSLSTDAVAAKEGFVLIPKGIEFDSYYKIFVSRGYMGAFTRSVWITLAATAVSMILTTMLAYGLSQSGLMFRTTFNNLILITMVIDGGIIPFYMVVRNLGMIDTYASLIIPMAIQTYNLILMRNFFKGIPESLMESARLDGASEMRTMVSIVLPISVPIIAAITLFYLVSHWNRYFEVIMFINDSKKFTLQVLLRQMLFQSESSEGTASILFNNFKMAVMVMTMLPILIVYPFVQKYFISGLMLGSVKG